jgi:hypothetical protein
MHACETDPIQSAVANKTFIRNHKHTLRRLGAVPQCESGGAGGACSGAR